MECHAANKIYHRNVIPRVVALNHSLVALATVLDQVGEDLLKRVHLASSWMVGVSVVFALLGSIVYNVINF